MWASKGKAEALMLKLLKWLLLHLGRDIWNLLENNKSGVHFRPGVTWNALCVTTEDQPV